MKILVIALALFAVTPTLALAQARLGSPGYDAYEAGDYAKTLKHWMPQAEAGDPDIQTRIAIMNLLGEGLEKNAAKAAEWFMKASKQNFGKAQYQLGRLYAAGNGVEKSVPQAFVMWSAADVNGETRSSSDLSELEGKMTLEQRAEGEKQLAAWWQEYPLPVVEEVVEVDNRTAMQKFNDWLLGLMPEGMVSKPH